MRSKEKVDRLIYEILAVLRDNKQNGAMGATAISKELEKEGFEIGERAVRYHLKHLDDKGFTEKLGPRKGRVITEMGEEELKTELVGERVGFVLGRIKELIYEMSYDLQSGDGTIIINLSLFNKEDIDSALEIMNDVMERGWAPSHLIKMVGEGERIRNFQVPEGKIEVATVCSITIDGLLENEGVPVSPKLGGVLEIEEEKPKRFVDAITYQGTSVDPLEVFASRRMTSYLDIIKKGSGRILANLREIPIPARSQTLEIIEKSKEKELDAVLKVGSPADSLYGLPVGVNRIGIAIAGGINPVVAVEETGIEVNTTAMENTLNISEMAHIRKYL